MKRIFFVKNVKPIIKHVLLGMLVIGITVALCQGIVLFYQNKGRIIKTLSYSLTSKPEALTELYFENNENIAAKPSVITNFDAVPYTFSFSIHNLEGKDFTYLYDVTMSGMSDRVLDQKIVSIKKGQTKTILETFYLPNVIPLKTKITVLLTNKNSQSISFWIGGPK